MPGLGHCFLARNWLLKKTLGKNGIVDGWRSFEPTMATLIIARSFFVREIMRVSRDPGAYIKRRHYGRSAIYIMFI